VKEIRKMEYKIYVNENGEKRVKFLDCKYKSGKCIDYCINKDKEGKEYFAIPNMKNEKSLFLFSGRLYDAIESIRNDSGDVLSVNTTGSALFGGTSVYRYVDRKYGEELRTKTIEGWKDTKFGYGLKFGYKNSFNSGCLLDTKNENYYGFDNQEKLTFTTIQEAEQYKNNILNNLKRLQDQWDILKINNSNKLDKFFHKNYKKYKLEMKMLKEYENEENDWYLDIVQEVV
jgi:hypothetical protein